MNSELKHVATLHLPLPAKQAATLLLSIESQFAGSHVRGADGYKSDRLEVWAPAPAGVQILTDVELDEPSEDEAAG